MKLKKWEEEKKHEKGTRTVSLYRGECKKYYVLHCFVYKDRGFCTLPYLNEKDSGFYICKYVDGKHKYLKKLPKGITKEQNQIALYPMISN